MWSSAKRRSKSRSYKRPPCAKKLGSYQHNEMLLCRGLPNRALMRYRLDRRMSRRNSATWDPLHMPDF
ncbi:hypothetical protein V5799_030493 [Amblyomma americanum]|uniref:Uncharacterized protein n=1 Tax=Amblyomma americanum TaxID=6943 RepID=A0AAQ4EN01_AMBAM